MCVSMNLCMVLDNCINERLHNCLNASFTDFLIKVACECISNDKNNKFDLAIFLVRFITDNKCSIDSNLS